MKKTTLLIGFAFTTLACNTSLKGEKGELSLHYTHGGLFESVDNSIAVGLQTDIQIRSLSSEAKVSILDAYTDDDSMLSVDSISGEDIALLSMSTGTINLHVNSNMGADIFSLTSAEIASVEFASPITSLQSDMGIHPVEGSQLWIPRSLYDANGKPLTGYGLQPGDISPVERGSWIIDGKMERVLIEFESAGEMSLSYHDGEQKTYTILPSAEVTNWVIKRFDNEQPSLAVDNVILVQTYAEFADGKLGLTGLQTNDESICTVTSLLDSADTFTIKAITPGICSVSQGGNPNAGLELEIIAR